jgi:photosystem II stability/assembly factor-like uncharacterized protein
LEEAQPEVPNGGRANTIADNPSSRNIVLVASETGGLFRSTDTGATWTHIDALPEYATMAVRFLNSDASIAIATVQSDFRTSNGGGIWRSSDWGLTWTQVYSPASPYGTPDRFTAREISIAADSGAIYVATNFGVAISNDQGLTWRLTDPFGGSYHEVMAVVAQRGGLVLAAGPTGLRRSVDGGTTWLTPTTPVAAVWDIHALGGSPLSAGQVYVVDGSTNLWASEDAGDHWTQLTAAPGGGGSCGGIGFIKAVSRRMLHGVGLRLYFGNRCGAYWLTPPRITGTNQFNLTGAWTAMVADHGDTRDIAFGASNAPLLLASDGGLHKTADGGATWTFTGGGSGGYNALQVTEVTSQHIGSGDFDLYYGTQDNDIRATEGFDPTWPASLCCEGFFFEMQRQVASDADSQVTFVDCYPCGRYRSGRRFSGRVGWPSPPSPASDPKIVGRSFHVEAVGDSATVNPGLAVTHDLGSTWLQYAEFDESIRALPKLSRRTGRPPFLLPSTVLYQAIQTGWDWTLGIEINRLLRTEQVLGPEPSVTYPLMNNFGGLGINRTMFAWYQVFAVDPLNPNHLIAPDIIEEKMKESWDGGDDWSNRADITELVTGSGAFRFGESIFPQASAISFSEDDPNMVAVGTMQNGILISTDRGVTWDKIYGSERATYITSIDWISPLSAMVSTYGRGLWTFTRIFKVPPYWKYCLAPCHLFWIPRDREDFVDPSWDPVPERLKRSIVVLDGRILGAKIIKGSLTDLYVTAGSGVVWRSEADVPQLAVRTASKWQGFQGMGRVRSFRTDEPIVGLALNAKNLPIGAVTSARPLKSEGLLPAAASQQERASKLGDVGTRRSPTAGQPKVSIEGAGAANRVLAGVAIVVTARGLTRGMPVIVQIDGQVVARGKAADNGSLRLSVKAPVRFGLHALTLFDMNAKGITGMNFLVVHGDERERGHQVNPTTAGPGLGH